MRGIPLLVTLLFLYYGLPSAGIKLDAFTVGVIALSITSGAYIAEIVRAGIQSIDPGQMRAARSLGMSYAKAMRRIILPQALRRVLPPMTNEALTPGHRSDSSPRRGRHRHRAERIGKEHVAVVHQLFGAVRSGRDHHSNQS